MLVSSCYKIFSDVAFTWTSIYFGCLHFKLPIQVDSGTYDFRVFICEHVDMPFSCLIFDVGWSTESRILTLEN